MFKYRNIEDAEECPFYLEDENGEHSCMLKTISNPQIITSIINSPTKLTKKEWNSNNCGGSWEKCTFVPIFYDITSSEENYDPEKEIEDFEPYEEESEEDDEIEGKEVLVHINKVSSVYKIKCDVLIYPTNINLSIDDDELNRLSYFQIQAECDQIFENQSIKLSDVFETSNGGEKSEVVPSKIYHAVVACGSKLVSHHISEATIKSLIKADKKKAKIVCMLPMDCGMIDVQECARIQLDAVKMYTDKYTIKNIDRIHVVMEDDESAEIFADYFNRIFE